MNVLYTLWILTTAGQCTQKTYKTLKAFNSPKDVYDASYLDFDSSLFTKEEIKCFSSKSLTEAENIIKYCNENEIKIITYYDEEYPSLLKEIYDPPLALFVKGKLPYVEEEPSISIIGTRNCTEEGMHFAAKISHDLSLSGFTVVSGMAEGIDTYAHKGALLAKKSSIAVLAGGVDIIYPQQNRELYDLLCLGGAVISECLPKTSIKSISFHIRNRIISGLTYGTLVVETGEKGGSLITIRHALEQNRMIFAVPGFPKSSASIGANLLIKSGAILCTSGKDIINEYMPIFKDKIKPITRTEIINIKQDEKQKKAEVRAYVMERLSEKEQKIYLILANGPISADDICNTVSMLFNEVITVLQGLELMGYIESVQGGYFKIKN
ncbi:MAG: protecting protein DprA [Clostridia bacterium]|nr:protecting protein DprA [Clostridia bacterium]